jgi:hypothetical protein
MMHSIMHTDVSWLNKNMTKVWLVMTNGANKSYKEHWKGFVKVASVTVKVEHSF